ncbi:ribonucleoside-diphosphate reductase class Ib glutaredoxin subunit [Atopostipes suicloacalis DSM 15692]|uniref:Ribonucleoside-diphosphate reductase class Ib glutaredoxin subunit n=1 Tax=Atopostipes suicloacalis DSM 15692 TaxID=1121025 RepID=A0A1M4V750_9LACT|nr:glutaredoxin domain-containing protein [Atopostipes suicloacalis]SHE64795.1 ribonucleoside-diphosphate reductase class Ib glutaredoxin subunit [Atopostipes suicloacalis DSM 15692]
MSITVYSKSGCPECTFTKKYLESENITYEEKRVDLNDTYMEEVILLGYRTLPVVKINEEETFTGYRPEKLENMVLEWQR